MRSLAVLLLLSLSLAGCADGGTETTQGVDGVDPEVEVDATTGAIRGLVVDNAITPLEGIAISAVGGGDTLSATSDAEGIFTFSKIEPGSYVIKASHPMYGEQQSSTIVEAGVEKPPLVRIQMDRLYDLDPYQETQQYKGFVGCAYNYGISSTCVNDYTRIDPTGTCNGGCAPFITGIVDQREYMSGVGAGWNSIIWEMVWDSSVSGTADEMQITVSYEKREGASHWFTSGSMAQPYRLQCDLGVNCPEMQQSNGPPQIDPEGRDDLWNMISAGDSNIALQQKVEVFQTNFYYAPSPSDWSFIEGDGNPY